MDGTAVFLFDGDCAFCSACARFLRRRVPTPARVEAWQLVELGPLGVTASDCHEAVQWVDGGGARSGPAAIAALLRTSRWYWRVAGRVLATRPVQALAWPAYRWVARNRDRMPGGTTACAVPQRSATMNASGATMNASGATTNASGTLMNARGATTSASGARHRERSL